MRVCVYVYIYICVCVCLCMYIGFQLLFNMLWKVHDNEHVTLLLQMVEQQWNLHQDEAFTMQPKHNATENGCNKQKKAAEDCSEH